MKCHIHVLLEYVQIDSSKIVLEPFLLDLFTTVNVV